MPAPVKVGLLHSLSGPMAIAERHLLSAELLAIAEINDDGGVLGRQIEAVIEDGQSEPTLFADKARGLIDEERVATLFGCWTSSARKAVKPVVEERCSLLFYPIQYEGLEQSRHIIYTGSCLNQQVTPAVDWLLAQGKRDFCLIGSDHVYARAANGLVRSQLSRAAGRVAGETYVPLDGGDFSAFCSRIRADPPDVILSTVEGEGNVAFFRQYARSGLDPTRVPVVSLGFSELELAEVKQEAAGHFACWSYFQGVESYENSAFLERFRQRFGAHARVADAVATAYTQVYLWKRIAEQAGACDALAVLEAAPGARVTGPFGVVEIHPNHHVARRALIGRAGADGQFRIVWSSEAPIAPKPWLGLEDVALPTQGLIREALERFSEALHLNAQLEQEVALRRKAEALLEEKARRLLQLNQAVEQSPTSIVVTDLDGVITYVNPQFTSLTGYTAEEAVGRNAGIVRSGQTPEAVYRQMWQTIKAGRTWHGEFLNRKKNGDLYWEQAVMAPVNDSHGELISFIAVKEDITERKRMEASLRASEARFREVFDSIAHGIFIIDVAEGGEFRIADSNKAEEAFTSIRREDLAGKTLGEAFPPAIARALHANYTRSLEARQPIAYEEDVDLPGVGLRSFLTTLAPVRDESGRFRRIIGGTIEISERRRAERALQQANERLEAQLREIKELQVSLQEQAIRDPLTGLYNRRFLFEVLQQQINFAARQSRELSLIMLDIDYFKEINDSYGHAAGDAYLVRLADVLRRNVRKSDVVCRYGGEEILILLPDCSLLRAGQGAEKLRLLAEKVRVEHEGRRLAATISLGVAVYPLHGAVADEIVRHADRALYASKRAGRNRTTVWSEDLASDG